MFDFNFTRFIFPLLFGILFSKYFEFLFPSTMDPLKEGELGLEFDLIKKIQTRYFLHSYLI